MEGKTIADIATEMSGRDDENAWVRLVCGSYAQRIKEANKQEAESIERLVRDAIIGYQEMYAHAPNDDAERELVERAERGNAWLVAHGLEPENLVFSKEEAPCL